MGFFIIPALSFLHIENQNTVRTGGMKPAHRSGPHLVIREPGDE